MSLQDLGQSSWIGVTHDMDMYNKTGTSDETVPRLNMNYLIMPEVMSCDITGVTGCLKYELVVSTKWRLYNSKLH